MGHEGENAELLFQLITAVTGLIGIYIAWVFWFKKPATVYKLKTSSVGNSLYIFLLNGLGFDWLYDHLFVRPFIWIAQFNKNDVIDLLYTGIAGGVRGLNRIFSRTQNGNIQWYAAGIIIGLIITLALVLFL